jgi:hypothetical protein
MIEVEDFVCTTGTVPVSEYGRSFKASLSCVRVESIEGQQAKVRRGNFDGAGRWGIYRQPPLTVELRHLKRIEPPRLRG